MDNERGVMGRIARVALAIACLGGCACPQSIDALKQQLELVESFCRGKTPEVFLECPINRGLLQAKILAMETPQPPPPEPDPRTRDEIAVIVARSVDKDREWQGKAAAGRAPRDFNQPITLVLKSSVLFRRPGLDTETVRIEFLSNPFPGIVCGTRSPVNIFGGHTDITSFTAYFDPYGQLSKIAEPPPLPPERIDAMYADRLNGVLAASDEAALFRICGIIHTY
jgi:hypothetical protein